MEDQFDFHSYGVRKFNLKSYIDLLRFEDNIYDQPIFQRAVTGMQKCFEDIIEDPSLCLIQQLEKVQLQAQPAITSDAEPASVEENASSALNPSSQEPAMKLTDAASATAGEDADETEVIVKKTDEDPFGLEYLKGDPVAKQKQFIEKYGSYIRQK